MKITRLEFKNWEHSMNFLEEHLQISREENPKTKISEELSLSLRKLENLIEQEKWAYHCLLIFLNNKFLETGTEPIHYKSSVWYTGIELFLEIDGHYVYFNLYNFNQKSGLKIDYIGSTGTDAFWIQTMEELYEKTKEYIDKQAYIGY